MRRKLFSETELAALAKRFRIQTGKTKIQIANELNISRPCIQLAEENPEQSLTKLRIRMIEHCSGCEVVGPVFMLRKKKRITTSV